MELLKQSLQQVKGDASRAIFDGGDVTFKRFMDGTSVDNRWLAADHSDIVAKYTIPRPGSRRFVITGEVAQQPRESTYS